MQNIDPTRLINDFSAAFTNASLALQLQDINKCESAVQFANTLQRQLDTSGNSILRTKAAVYLAGTNFFLCILKFNQFCLEFRIDKAVEVFKESGTICEQGVAAISEFKPESEEEQDFKIIFGVFFKVLTIYISGVKYIVDTELLPVVAGNKLRPFEAYRMAASKLREVNDLGYIPEPFITNLIDMIRSFSELYDRRADKLKKDEETIQYISPKGRKIFIVHGHDEVALRIIEKFISEQLHLEVVILKDESNLGDTVIEKFEDQARECGYAIAILTTDDIVRNKKNKYLQARPNVLFELGWFCGRFGRQRMCIIKKKGTEIPSDLGGIICLEFSESVDEVKEKIKKELIAAGFILLTN